MPNTYERFKQWSRYLLYGGCAMAALQLTVSAQEAKVDPVTDALLQNPPAQSWLSWRGGPDSWGYSPLGQINRENVSEVRLVWYWAMDDTGPGEAAPLVHEGVLLLPNPGGVIQAFDAAKGDLLWEYRPDNSDDAVARSGPQKNIAIYGERVFVTTENASILALDIHDGHLLWETAVADPALGYTYTAGPIVADGVLVSCINGCLFYKDDVCFITGHDPDSGEELWRTSTVARPGEPGGYSWGDLPLRFRAGSDAWIAGSYDAETGLVYWGTSQAKPWARVQRGTAGDALYTNSTLALDPHTGDMVWYYQHLPGETHDMDDGFENVLIDIDGRRSLFKIGKLAILWQLDRVSGEFIRATDLGYQNIVNVDPVSGEVVYRDGMLPRIGEQLDFCPSTTGFKSWRAMAYSPETVALYIPITLNCKLATFGPVEQVLGGGGMGPVRRTNYPHPDAGDNLGELLAINLPDGDVRWRYRSRAPVNTAALATAGGLVFFGDWDRYVMALD